MAQIYIEDAHLGVEQIVFLDGVISIEGATNTCTISYGNEEKSTVVITSASNGAEVTKRVKAAIKKVDGGGGATVDMADVATTTPGIAYTI